MAVAIRSTGTGASGSANNSNLGIAQPSGLTAGDLMVAIVGWRSTTDPTAPSSTGAWTLQGSSKPGMGVWIYTKVANSSDVAATGGWTWTGTSARNAGIVYALTGATTLSPGVSAVTTDGSTGSSNAMSDGGAFVTAYSDMVLMGMFIQNSASFTESCASTFTVAEDFDQGQTSGSFGACHATYNGGAASGVYGVAGITMTASSNGSRAAAAINIYAAAADPDASTTVTYVGGGWSNGNVGYPGSAVAGDLAVVQAGANFSGPQKPTGYTWADGVGTGCVSWKILNSTDISNGQTSGLGPGSATLMVFRNTDTTAPINVYNYSQSGGRQVTTSGGTPTATKGYHALMTMWFNTNTSGGGPSYAWSRVIEDNSNDRRYDITLVSGATASPNWAGGAAAGVANGSLTATGSAQGYATLNLSGPNLQEFAILVIIPPQHSSWSFFPAAMMGH